MTAAITALGVASAPAGAGTAAIYQVPDSIAGDCSVDVTSALLSWIATVPDNSTLSFETDKCYRIEGTLEFYRRHGLDFEGNDSSFRTFAPPADQRAVWRAWDSSGLKFHDMAVQGSYASGGTFEADIQHAHAIDLRGTNAEIDRVTISNVGGDCVYFGLGGTSTLTRSSGSVQDSRCTGTGRNAISVTAGNNILVRRVTTNAIGYDVFDVEPNIGMGWGSRSVTFDSNAIGTYAKSAYSLVENEPISSQAFTNNRVIGRGLKITVGQSAIATSPHRVSGVTITGNSAHAAQAPSAMNLSAITGLTISDNAVPLTGGTMASVDTSCIVDVAHNSYPGGARQAYVARYRCDREHRRRHRHRPHHRRR